MAMVETAAAFPVAMQTQEASLPEKAVRWAGRTAMRTAGIEAGEDAFRYLTTRGKPAWWAFIRSIGAGFMSLPFPSAMAVHQSQWGKGFGGTLLTLAALGSDLTADTIGLFPVVGHISRFKYQVGVAGVAEAILPKRRDAVLPRSIARRTVRV